jgi:hypothetical protein
LALIDTIPELIEPITAEFGADYDFDEEFPGSYLIFEDVVKPFLYKNLDECNDLTLLPRLFNFFELMAAPSDKAVSDLLRIAILETLAYRKDYYRKCLPYMGTKTKEFALREQERITSPHVR